ncbi:MAG TPA: hypothetical protein VE153_32815 [Myxococcus sp.]|nr:hypothetical protein [Myxococcus sp.]
MPTPRYRLFAFTMLLLLLGCPGPSTPPDPSDPPDLSTPPEEIASTRAALDDFARSLYDHAEAPWTGQRQPGALEEEVRRAIFFMGFPMVGSNVPDDEFERELVSFEPRVFDFELGFLARGLESGMMVTIESLLSDLENLGFRAMAPATSLTREYLMQELAPLAAKSEYTPAERPLALLLALGRERARRSGATPLEPVFGDDSLDPLQLGILMREVLPIYAAARAQVLPDGPQRLQFSKSGGGGAAGALLLDKSLDHVGNAADAIDKGNQISTQMEVMVGGTKLQLQASPQELWRPRAGVTTIHVSDLKATVSFDVDISDLDELNRVLSSGATIPKNGPMEGISVQWGVDELLKKNGKLSQILTRSDAKGQASTQFTVTRSDNTSRDGWVKANEKHDDGHVRVQVDGLIPGFPRVEAWSRRLDIKVKDGVNASSTELKVYYYERPAHLRGTVTVVSERQMELNQGTQITTYNTRLQRELQVDVGDIGGASGYWEEDWWDRVSITESRSRADWDYEAHAENVSSCTFVKTDITGSGMREANQDVTLSLALRKKLESSEFGTLALSIKKGPLFPITGARTARHTVRSCNGSTYVSESSLPWDDTLGGESIDLSDTIDPTDPPTIEGTLTLTPTGPTPGVTATVKVSWKLVLEL